MVSLCRRTYCICAHISIAQLKIRESGCLHEEGKKIHRGTQANPKASNDMATRCPFSLMSDPFSMGVDNAHELNNLLSTPYFTEVGRHLFARPVTTVYLYTYFCHISTPVSSVMVITSFKSETASTKSRQLLCFL